MTRTICAQRTLEKVSLTDFEVFVEYLTLYYKDDAAVENGEKGIARKDVFDPVVI